MVAGMVTASVLIVAAWLTDIVVGDPEWAPHPVRWMGRAISAGDNAMNRGTRSNARAFAAGALLTIVVVGTSAGAAWLIVGGTRAASPVLGAAVEITLAATTLATRSLIGEARAVLTAIRGGAVDIARARLSRIVGRDTRALEPGEMLRAVIETVAESTSDGIIAPLLYLAIGGVPAAMAYKAVNTLDSMIGHPEPPHQWFGTFSARLDDVANYVPSRITAALIAVAPLIVGGHPWQAIRTWRTDGHRHASPNAGQVEATMAGALGVQLGGSNFYDGVEVRRQLIGTALPAPSLDAANRAIVIAFVCSVLGCALAASFAHMRDAWR
jgi:adenosylcobinamide-phosphate synthase